MKLSINESIVAGLDGLVRLERLLDAQNERNWIRGIRAALTALRHEDGTMRIEGLSDAGSIYRTMTAGGRGFSEYFIWNSDDDARLAANHELDQLRERLWTLFGSED